MDIRISNPSITFDGNKFVKNSKVLVLLLTIKYSHRSHSPHSFRDISTCQRKLLIIIILIMILKRLTVPQRVFSSSSHLENMMAIRRLGILAELSNLSIDALLSNAVSFQYQYNYIIQYINKYVFL